MNTISFTCQVITPMFLAGADGQTPEFRPPSIKGAMRFWWRALHCHLSLRDMHTLEGQIFGDNSQRSCFSIRVNAAKPDHNFQAKPVPHKNYTIGAIAPRTNFTVTLCWSHTPAFSFQKLCALFELTALLGGLGKRSRRAMGSFSIIEKVQDDQQQALQHTVKVDYIHSLIQLFSPHYQQQPGGQPKIINTYQGTLPRYPWIKQIDIGQPKNTGAVPSITSNVTHHMKNKYGHPYEVNLGHAFRGRFASPVFVSVVENQQTPIITTLYTEPDRNHRLLDASIQQEFKKNIL